MDKPNLAVRLLEVLSLRLRRPSEQAESLSFETPDVRLAKALIRLADLQGTGSEPQPHVTVTQRALGQLIGLSRESTNKHLREWEVAGLVKLEKGICIICAPTALRRKDSAAP
jgi:CRP/FNR family transcriptional regulator, cyclic AMP receptor protein